MARAVSITYVPADCGSVIPGKTKAPKAFRDVQVVKKLSDAGFASVREHHALEAEAKYSSAPLRPGRARNEEANVSMCKQVQASLEKSLPSDSGETDFQLILGGECGMLPGIMTALWGYAQSLPTPKRIGLVYIDADTDLASLNDPVRTGTFAGMNMTNLVRSDGALPSMRQFSQPNGEPVCDASNTVFFGTNMALAGNTRGHFGYLFDKNYKLVTSTSVSADPEQRAREALEYLEERVDIILVHLDVDAIDPGEFPLANLPNYTGVTFQQMMRALGVFVRSPKVQGLSVAEVNPDHDPELRMTEQLTKEIVNMLAERR